MKRVLVITEGYSKYPDHQKTKRADLRKLAREIIDNRVDMWGYTSHIRELTKDGRTYIYGDDILEVGERGVFLR